jgi:uncharacterized protein YcaQ
MRIIRDLGYIQIDPMRVVERSHVLVLWSRIGKYNPSILDDLLWRDRQLFEDWAQATSIVPTQDYPIFKSLKQSFATGDSSWAQKIRMWLEKNWEMKEYVLTQLLQKGPLPSSSFEDKTVEAWRSTGWTSGRNVDMMLTCLMAKGEIMVAKRKGNLKYWDLSEHHLPQWVSKELLSDREVSERAAQKSLRALGVAPANQIKRHYIRSCYKDLDKVLTELEADGHIISVQIQDGGRTWRGKWYIHASDIPLLERLVAGDWEPHTTLLSPFDNLICDRRRTEQLFNFHFRLEIYLPKSKRKYGCYVMPILHGDHFIGRVDPRMDRKNGVLNINAVYAELKAPRNRETAQAVANTVRKLGDFLGARKIVYGRQIPSGWKRELS